MKTAVIMIEDSTVEESDRIFLHLQNRTTQVCLNYPLLGGVSDTRKTQRLLFSKHIMETTQCAVLRSTSENTSIFFWNLRAIKQFLRDWAEISTPPSMSVNELEKYIAITNFMMLVKTSSVLQKKQNIILFATQWWDNEPVTILSTVVSADPKAALKRFDRASQKYRSIEAPAWISVLKQTYRLRRRN